MAMDAGEIEQLIKQGIPDAQVAIEDLRGDGDHYAATVPAKFAKNVKPQRFRRVLLSFRKLATLVAAGDSEGAQKHWTQHMQTAATTLLGDDLKNKKIVDLFN